METRERTVAAGCGLAAASTLAALATWSVGAAPGLRGVFEDERDLSLVAVELPAMLVAFPVLALTAAGALRRRPVLAACAATAVLALCAWAGIGWLESRTAHFRNPQ